VPPVRPGTLTSMVIVIVLLAVILAFLIGIAVVGLVFKLLWFVLIGLVIGALARLVLPGAQQIGVLGTALCGIGGSLLGGIIASAFDLGTILSFLVSLAAAAVLIAVVEGRQPRTI
jgi:uncharacterized membrane protein YeaQ/YmgE (transglycosylase-associated protein family)